MKHDGLKRELLEHYAAKEPKAFYQYDGWLNADSVTGRDAEGDGATSDVTYELMHGADVRVLIPAETNARDAARLLKKIRQWIRRDGFATATMAAQQRRLEADDPCPRCRMAMQATHHPLCEFRDGTPTPCQTRRYASY